MAHQHILGYLVPSAFEATIKCSPGAKILTTPMLPDDIILPRFLFQKQYINGLAFQLAVQRLQQLTLWLVIG